MSKNDDEKFVYYDENDNRCEREFTQLEKDFLSLQENVEEKIQNHLNKAKEELRKAVKISEKYGIPFSTSISFLGNTYFPESFEEKFTDLDREWLSEIAGIWSDNSPGWRHSAVC